MKPIKLTPENIQKYIDAAKKALSETPTMTIKCFCGNGAVMFFRNQYICEDCIDKFIDIKRYLLNEFDWKVDPMKKSQFIIRGIPINDDRKLSDILNAFLPDEVITLKEV